MVMVTRLSRLSSGLGQSQRWREPEPLTGELPLLLFKNDHSHGLWSERCNLDGVHAVFQIPGDIEVKRPSDQSARVVAVDSHARRVFRPEIVHPQKNSRRVQLDTAGNVAGS